MIAARLAGGNLFLPFLEGDLVVGIFWSTRSSSEHSEFLRGDFFLWGFFFCGVVGCVLD